MSGLSSPNSQRKHSTASSHSVDISEQSPKGKSEKRAGRRKIKIEYIDDKSRRHITFSKRKAGIMKKKFYRLKLHMSTFAIFVNEASSIQNTLTGTQVLLLVVSETGLVYTFTTPKLQPLVTKPEGKNLIQACLNAPDTPSAQDPTSTQRSATNASVYGNDQSVSVDNSNNDDYDRKPQAAGQMPQTQQQSYAPALGLPNYNYGGLSNNMALSATGGIAAPPYMPTNSYPQYNQQHLAAQYAPNNYMQSAYGWSQTAGGNSAPNAGKVQYTQSSEKK
ncbi:24246_t:CDS:2 [Dentiscutata erythropus]|uniref:24246_t:CDS:1 n=1 Tax=Dentiscutata erythropus TaxID=1348616 RepID=A0A9N8ZGK2_9GLOM|nr:24246_t:CDS:2 [Dentiscutata erythropus]